MIHSSIHTNKYTKKAYTIMYKQKLCTIQSNTMTRTQTITYTNTMTNIKTHGDKYDDKHDDIHNDTQIAIFRQVCTQLDKNKNKQSI